MVANSILGITMSMNPTGEQLVLVSLKGKVESMIVALPLEHFASNILVRVFWISLCVMWLKKEWF